MKKRFNSTGKCTAEKHYMMDNSAKLDKVMELIEYGHYFAINRPRQYGKTTTLLMTGERLRKTEDYFRTQLSGYRQQMARNRFEFCTDVYQ
jgi:predicted AAA+ superfamily ATPase